MLGYIYKKIGSGQLRNKSCVTGLGTWIQVLKFQSLFSTIPQLLLFELKAFGIQFKSTSIKQIVTELTWTLVLILSHFSLPKGEKKILLAVLARFQQECCVPFWKYPSGTTQKNYSVSGWLMELEIISQGVEILNFYPRRERNTKTWHSSKFLKDCVILPFTILAPTSSPSILGTR